MLIAESVPYESSSGQNLGQSYRISPAASFDADLVHIVPHINPYCARVVNECVALNLISEGQAHDCLMKRDAFTQSRSLIGFIQQAISTDPQNYHLFVRAISSIEPGLVTKSMKG